MSAFVEKRYADVDVAVLLKHLRSGCEFCDAGERCESCTRYSDLAPYIEWLARQTEQPKAEIDGDQMLELRDDAFNLLPAWPKSTVDERPTISGRIVHKVVAELKRRGFLERPEQASGVLPIEVFAVMDLALHNELHLRDRGHKECDALCIKCAAEKAAAVLGFES